ncbi:hypothetical protein V8D89_016283 [Ganoderma adspersum]
MTDVHTSACNLVLTNSDLLHSVFTFVIVPPRWTRSQHDRHDRLARCATVCHGFHESAIRIIWRKLDSFFPLWHLLAPPNAKRPSVTKEEPHYVHQVISARLYDNPTVWERFLWHTTHVRHIAHFAHRSDPSETNAAQLLLIQAVLLKNGGETVLPLLRSIHWKAKASTDSSLSSFFTPTLRSATLHLASGPGDEEARALLLHRLQESSPYLEKIEIGDKYGIGKDLAAEPQLVRELLSFDRLRELRVHCGLPGPATFLDLISKPNLTALGVRNVSGPFGAPSSPILVRDLLELSIEGPGPTLVGLFNLVRLEALESATIEIEDSHGLEQDTDDVLKAFYGALPSPSTLRSLTLRTRGWRSDRNSNAISLRDLLRPVLPLREIRSFKYDSHALLPRIAAVDIAALAEAWPKLERLVLDAPPPSAWDAFPLDALRYIHAHCTHLRELETQSVRLPVLGVHAIPAPLDRSPPHPLRQLWASGVYVYRPDYEPGHIVAEHAEALARYVLDLFPALDTEEYSRWLHRPGVRQTSAPLYCLNGRQVLRAMYGIASEQGQGRQ